MTCEKEIIEQYWNADKELTLLAKGSSKPIKKDWTNEKVDDAKILSHKGNLGWVIGHGDAVLDVDPRNGGDKSFEQLQKDLGIRLHATVRTPSGGTHTYLSIPSDWLVGNIKFRKTLKKKYPGIDFLTKGSQCAIVSSSRPDGSYAWEDPDFGCFEQIQCPKALFNLFTRKTNGQGTNGGNSLVGDSGSEDLGDFEGLISSGGSNWPEEKVLDFLSKLDHNMPNDDWVRVGMALHDWDTFRGLELWEGWSIGGDTYKEGETEKRWRSFDAGSGVSLGTISYMVKEVEFEDREQEINAAIDKLRDPRITIKDIRLNLIPEFRKLNLTNMEIGRVATPLKAVIHRLERSNPRITDVKNEIKPEPEQHIVNGVFIEDGEKPEWCEKWVYVNSHTSFLNLEKMHFCKTEGFNIECGKLVPPGENGSRRPAARYVSERGYINAVASTAYLPEYEDKIVEINGTPVVNTFNHKSVPEEAHEFTSEGKKAIKRVKKHIELVCGSKKDAEILTLWLAHQVQNPGRKILWSPVIQSIEGIGKSFFGTLLRYCLGYTNVGTVSSSQVTSEFNSWATDVVVNILEELRIKGHNRHDAVNALKPLITDEMIQINAKGAKQFMTRNTANYICFTNYKDAIPLTDTDRRWWIIFSPWRSIDNMTESVREKKEIYFPKLFDSVREYGPEIRKWMLEMEIPYWFKNMKQAPMTKHKQAMIATEEAAVEGLSEVREMIQKGGKYYNEECISSADLFEDLAFSEENMEFSNFEKNRILKDLGYSKHPTKVKLDGKAKVFWTKDSFTNEEIRQSFENEKENDFLE